jgi:hypothetical protein
MNNEFNDVGNVGAADNLTAENLEQGSDASKINAGAIRKSQTQSILNALSNAAGAQFESVEAAVAWAARTGALQNLGGSAQPVDNKTQPQQKNRQSTNDLSEQFQRLQQDLSRKEQILREKELDGDIQRVMGEKFDNDLLDYALTKVKSNIQWNDDGTYAIVNSKGQERYGSDGNPLTVAGLVDEVARGNPKLLKQNILKGGSGLRPGSGMFAGAQEDGMPDYSRDPAAFNAWAQRNGLGKHVGLKGVGVSLTNSATSKRIF